MTPDPTELDAYNDLQAYTLAHGDPAFIHQHVVDTWTAQHAGSETKPIGLAFSLIGLHLQVDHGYTGRQVQRVHMLLGRGGRKEWPAFILPRERGDITAVHVMAAPAGPGRDRAIDAWGAAVWAAYAESHAAVAELLRRHGVA